MSVVKKSVQKIALSGSSRKNLTYLTKRLTLSKARAAGKLASQKAMKVMGYVVVAENDAVVKKYEDGRTEIIVYLQ
ncbi:MAG: hypothetical protein KA198_00385 [Chitinophagaceae bacterium]|nr:hypothetical protein [Chitinophagaceae bacterium]